MIPGSGGTRAVVIVRSSGYARLNGYFGIDRIYFEYQLGFLKRAENMYRFGFDGWFRRRKFQYRLVNKIINPGSIGGFLNRNTCSSSRYETAYPGRSGQIDG